MRKLLFAVVLSVALTLGIRSGVHAQEAPPAQNTGSIVTDQEAAILKGFFDKLNEATQGQPTDDDAPTIGDIVTDVIKTVNADAAGSDDDSDDDSEDESDEDNESDDEEESGDDDKGKDKKKNKGKGKDKNKNKGKNKDKNKKSDKSKGRGDGLPPGLQKQLTEGGKLPPGLQRKMEESGALPPGLQASGLPEELEAELPELPEGQERVVVDDDILIIEQATGAVLDAIPDIIPPDLAPILNQLPTILMDQQ